MHIIIQNFEEREQEVARKLCDMAFECYQDIKKESKTYSELRENLSQFMKEVKWTEPNMRNYFGGKFHELYEKEIENARIQ